MCFRCDCCGEASPPRTAPVRVAFSHPTIHPKRERANPPAGARRRQRRKRTTDAHRTGWHPDNGGTGSAFSRSALYCAKCACRAVAPGDYVLLGGHR